ncbi:TPA: hypothetical protein ACNUUW_004274, partial [Aeromonas salmonicida subsp. salmonicida]
PDPSHGSEKITSCQHNGSHPRKEECHGQRQVLARPKTGFRTSHAAFATKMGDQITLEIP